jgi:Oxidoreductase-like protein, N-terminal
MPSPAAEPDPPPVPPERPDLNDCCTSGCNPCIFDIYEDAVERYRDALRAWEERQKARATAAAPRRK